MGPVQFSLLAASVLLAATAAYLGQRARKTPEQRERERRERLNLIGRITDGTVTDVRELSANGHGSLQMLIYHYDVAGVSYEAAQDVTRLRHFLDLHACRIGVPASVKYDPHNPGNSIVVAEGWNGLRH